MLQRLITPRVSSEIIELLTKKRGWSVTRIAKRIGASRDYVLRVHRGLQNFEYADVESLAKACRQAPHEFVFDAMGTGKMSADERGLYALTREVVQSSKELQRALMRKPTKKRRTRAKAA